MKQSRPVQPRRDGFTLIEILIVMAIIGVLVALIASAVGRALGKANQTKCANEISQLATALENFKTKYGAYPPSRIRICERRGYYGATQFDLDSISFIQQMFPRIDAAGWANPGIDWNGNGNIDPANLGGDMILEGDQCMVFFLGGIPSIPSIGGSVPQFACLGFSSNPLNPAAAGGDRIPPFHEFDSNRLVILPLTPSSINRRSQFHYSYLDTYGTMNAATVNRFGSSVSIQVPAPNSLPSGFSQPYAYFSTYKSTRNNYCQIRYGNCDCPTLYGATLTVPYLEVAPTNTVTARFVNPASFQLMSGGADQTFGIPATTWTQSTAGGVFPNGNPGRDDQSNFSGHPLGY
jgi:prepilin-type N-terminal cleavage/methylation domain-containing protein